ncbi:MAG TPA: D-alanyl-D-alanine carboxypeptidase/D-alanyl-D-alanine-endopeptidase [Cyanobacteria bacterium UBA9971]|nr:D-alanyl-D-alanine carboxypeptidase/D-alanyl-D-alanine-endopeptidase [Cyanobacteria bacterium UBA9971]
MNFNKKFLLVFAIFLLSTVFLSGYESNYSFNSINNTINNSKLSKNSIVSVSIREIQSGKIVYQRDANLLLHPASTLKAFTTPVVLNVLGANYKLSTGIYKDNKGNIYLKLCGDPQLTAEDISKLLRTFKSKGYNAISGSLLIDDTAIDNIPWGVGWMWDDENNPYMPKYNAYNLNRNLITVKISPTLPNQKPKIVISPYYPVKIINNAVTLNKNSISAERKIWKNAETIYVEGKISSVTNKIIPVANPENFFKYQLTKAIKDNKIYFSGQYKKAKLPLNAILITEIPHNLLEEVKITNKNSDNLAAETLLKIAGGRYTAQAGSIENGLKAFNAFYNKLGVDTSEILIVDASGVSQNDLITANWMTNALTKLYKISNFAAYKSTLATPAEIGTLQNRLLNLKGRLFGKTGTNAGVSAITGYVTDKCGNTFAFSIIIQNFKDSSKPAKELEDAILQIFK